MPRLLIIGGGDAGISAGLRARELAPELEVTLLVADAYPSFSICGLPYLLAGEVSDWRSLAHTALAELEAAGLQLLLDQRAGAIDPQGQTVSASDRSGRQRELAYDRLIVATGAQPVRPPIDGLDTLGPNDGVHLLHTIDDAFAIERTLERQPTATAVIVGGGYIGLEMAEALTTRGLTVTLLEQLPQVMPTLEPPLAALLEQTLRKHGVDVQTATAVESVTRAENGLLVQASDQRTREAGLVLVSVGIRPDSALAASAGAKLGQRDAIVVDRHMRTNLANVYAAGDCVETYHRLLDRPDYLPLGTTAHKQGRIAGENAAAGQRSFAGAVGTQVVRVFDLVAARTGLSEHEATADRLRPRTIEFTAGDHNSYYPGAAPIHIRLTGDDTTGQLLGVQMVGDIHTAVAKRIDTAATALHAKSSVRELLDLDLSYTPPLGRPWDPLQLAAQAWLTLT